MDFSREREDALPGQNETQQEDDCHLHWSQYHGVQLVVLNQQSLRIVPNARREGNNSSPVPGVKKPCLSAQVLFRAE